MDPSDARVRWIGLSSRGAEMVEAARVIRAGMEAELAAELGAERIESIKSSAWRILDRR